MSDTIAATSADCLEMLSAYQGTVVHDLRGEMNGLLLTLDYLRRQLAARPETAALFAESMGDLDTIRGSLTQTLNQLDSVGQVRKAISSKAAAMGAIQGFVLTDAVGEIVTALAERTRRRGTIIIPPARDDGTVSTDPTITKLLLNRFLTAISELCRKAEVRLSVAGPLAGMMVLAATVSDSALLPQDVVESALASPPTSRASGPSALHLAVRLAQQLGGSLQRTTTPGEEACLTLDLPSND